MLYKRIYIVVGLALFMVSHQAFTVICKTLDDNGVVTYSDIPESVCEEPVAIRRIPPNFRSPVQPVTPVPITPPTYDSSVKPFQGYRQFSIDQPKSKSVVHNNLGRVPVRLILQPALQPGHRIQLMLDGIPVEPTASSTSVVLSQVDRGQHRLNAQVLDESNNVIKRAKKAVKFYLHKFSALNAPK